MYRAVRYALVFRRYLEELTRDVVQLLALLLKLLLERLHLALQRLQRLLGRGRHRRIGRHAPQPGSRPPLPYPLPSTKLTDSNTHYSTHF